MTTVDLVLSFDEPPLQTNRNQNRWEVTKYRRLIREEVFLRATAAKLPKGLPFVSVQLHYRPKISRDRDTDNLTPTAKPACDALTQGKPAYLDKKGKPHAAVLGYGLVKDDTPKYMRRPETQIHDPLPGMPGCVWLRIEWTDEDGAA